MQRYALEPKTEKSVKVFGRGLRISTKNSVIMCRAITGMILPKAQSLVENLLTRQQSLDGKYYTNVCKELLPLLKLAESNSEFKGLDPSRMFIHASAHEGFTFHTPRRFKRRGRKKKVTHLQLVLQKR